MRLVLFLMVLMMASVTHSATSPHKLSLLDLPMGQESTVVLSEATALWGSEPDCNTSRTGVGMTRRAYFLQTCKFNDTERNATIYDERVSTATYYFLENALVQVSYSFNNIVNEKKFRRCAAQDATKLESQADSTEARRLSVSDDLAEEATISVSTAIVDEIHSLQK